MAVLSIDIRDASSLSPRGLISLPFSFYILFMTVLSGGSDSDSKRTKLSGIADIDREDHHLVRRPKSGILSTMVGMFESDAVGVDGLLDDSGSST